MFKGQTWGYNFICHPLGKRVIVRLVNVDEIAANDYLPKSGGEILGILPIYTFSLGVERVLLHAGYIIRTTRGHHFSFHPTEVALEVFPSS